MRKPPPVTDMTKSITSLPALVTGACSLVSGATGFLGCRLAETLAGQGLRVRALARTTSDLKRLSGAGIGVVLGDVGDRLSLERAVEGQEVVFHTAGLVTDWGNADEFMRVNRDGTANVIDACRRMGVKHLIHISSLTVLGLPRDGRRIDEESPYVAAPSDPYTQSKIAAEQLAQAAQGQHGLRVTILRPGAIWGAGDTLFVPRLVALMRRGRMPCVGRGENLIGLSHVDNLVQGCMLAMERPERAGQIYHITDGEPVTLRQALNAIADAHQAARPRFSLPAGMLLFAAAWAEQAARWHIGPEPPVMTRYSVRMLASHCRYDIGKARRELGYEPLVNFSRGVAALKEHR
ncbi:MAG: NAD-dependent epimerase/dehydratase family protein [Smithellaceae bacterium]|nr:NAD-dependent epimerase/dehydratase family protein [Smithellaceae bacterium]